MMKITSVMTIKTILIILLFAQAVSLLKAQSPTGSITGELYSIEGSPISHAQVILAAAAQETRSNADGTFYFNDVPSKDYSLFINAAGYEPQEVLVTVEAGKHTHLTVTCQYHVTHLQEVVVSATKVDGLLDKIPLSVTSVPAREIENFRLQTMDDLTAVSPNFSFIDAGSKTHSMVSIRGINAFSTEPSVSLYVDGVNQFDMTSLNNSLFDVEKVEILRGPQSTLFGRNALGGVVNIVSAKPNNIRKGFARFETGNYGYQLYGLGYKGPLVRDKLFVGLSGQYDKRNGYYTNSFTGKGFDNEDNLTANLSLRYVPSGKVNLTYSSNFQFNDEKGVFPYAVNDSIALAAPYTTNVNRSSGTRRQVWNNSLTVQYAPKTFDMTSVTSYQFANRIFADTLDRDYTPYDLAGFIARGNNKGVPIHIITEELRFSSPKNRDSRLQWLAGTYVFIQGKDENYDQLTGKDAGLLAGDTRAPYINTTYSHVKNFGAALFGQATYAVTPKTHVTAGVRYDYEKRRNTIKAGFIKGNSPERITFPETEKQAAFRAFSPKIAVDHELGAKTNTYLSYSRGFRAGGINPYTTNSDYQNYGPEFSDNYEWGLKARLARDRISIRAALFLIEWKDQQVNTLVPGQGFQFGVLNVGEVESKGAELEFTAKPIKNVTLMYAFGYTDAYFTKLPLPDLSTGSIINYNGNKQIAAPDVTSRLAAQYHHPFRMAGMDVSAFLNGEWKYSGTQYFDMVNTIKQEPYHLLNMQGGISTGNIEITVWGKNLTDSRYLSFAVPFASRFSLLGNPQTYGVSLTAKF